LIEAPQGAGINYGASLWQKRPQSAAYSTLSCGSQKHFSISNSYFNGGCLVTNSICHHPAGKKGPKETANKLQLHQQLQLQTVAKVLATVQVQMPCGCLLVYLCIYEIQFIKCSARCKLTSF